MPVDHRSSMESNSGSLSAFRARSDQAQIEALEARTAWLQQEQSTLAESIQQLERENQILLKRAEEAEALLQKEGKKSKVWLID
jgi:cell division protein FtsB